MKGRRMDVDNKWHFLFIMMVFVGVVASGLVARFLHYGSEIHIVICTWALCGMVICELLRAERFRRESNKTRETGRKMAEMAKHSLCHSRSVEEAHCSLSDIWRLWVDTFEDQKEYRCPNCWNKLEKVPDLDSDHFTPIWEGDYVCYKCEDQGHPKFYWEHDLK